MKPSEKTIRRNIRRSASDPDFFNTEAIVGINVLTVDHFADDSLTVVNQFESDAFKTFAATLREVEVQGLT